MIKVTENLRKTQDLVTQFAVAAGRDPKTVKILAVSKHQPLEKVLAVAAAGQRDFGENFVQEGIDKIKAVNRNDLVWHFIGHLQTNKTRQVAEHFDWVHTVDRLKTAERLSAQRPPGLPPLNVCIQVNIDDEDSKSGIAPEDLPELAKAVATMPGLRLRGLMCLPAIRQDTNEQREPFAKLRRLANELNTQGMTLDTLSMGMSGDFEAAIAEGANLVRIGTAIFGCRNSEGQEQI